MALEKIEIDKKLLEYSLSQFGNIPEYVAICDAIAKGMVTIQDGVDYLLDMIDIDKAEGVWLDYIGWLVGEYRGEYIDTDEYFCINAEDVNDEKYFYFPNSNINGNTISTSNIDDNIYRNKIKAKIIYNYSNGTREDMIKIIKFLTNAIKIIINKISPMLLHIELIGDELTNTGKNEIMEYLPNGVGIDDIESTSVLNFETNVFNYNDIYYYNIYYYNFYYLNGMYFSLGDNGYITYGESPYEPTRIQIGNKSYHAITYGNGVYVVIGRQAPTMYSTDGINWTQSGNNITGENIVYGNGLFIVLGRFSFDYSADGINWQTKFYKDNMTHNFNNCHAVYGNDKFVAVGTDNSGNFMSIYSYDGINWEMGYVDAQIRVNAFRKIIYGNGVYVVLYDGNMFGYSTDGINWFKANFTQTEDIRTTGYFDVEYNPDKKMFVAIDGNYDNYYRFIYSFDGINWSKKIETEVPSSLQYIVGDLRAIVYNGEKFIVATSGNYIIEITDNL